MHQTCRLKETVSRPVNKLLNFRETQPLISVFAKHRHSLFSVIWFHFTSSNPISLVSTWINVDTFISKTPKPSLYFMLAAEHFVTLCFITVGGCYFESRPQTTGSSSTGTLSCPWQSCSAEGLIISFSYLFPCQWWFYPSLLFILIKRNNILKVLRSVPVPL